MGNSLGSALLKLPGPVMITGHTGFKGAWLTLLLQQLGVSVVGYSLKAEKNTLFERAKLNGNIPEQLADIRDYKKLSKFIEIHQPSIIIHMAAQPLVLESYRIPRETFDINVMGTVNLLDVAFATKSVQVVLVVTTDKVYRNDDSQHAFLELDPLEGKDPYSASKVGTEAVVKAWQQISEVSGGPKVVSVRAGNVIGGGDFAKDRIIPDLIRGYINKKSVEIRNPQSTRPWQHVLDPLVGYIMLLEKLLQGFDIHSLNFGPEKKGLEVRDVIKVAEKSLDFSKVKIIFTEKNQSRKQSESINLNLNSDLARKVLGWINSCDQETALRLTFEWWDTVLTRGENASQVTVGQINDFLGKNK